MSNFDDDGLNAFPDETENRLSEEREPAPLDSRDTGLLGPDRSSPPLPDGGADASGVLSGEESGSGEDDPMDPNSEEDVFREDFSLGSGAPETDGAGDEDYGGDSEIGFIVIDSQDGESGGLQDSEEPETPEYAPDESGPSQALDMLSSQISGLSEQMEQLSQDFESKLKYDSHKEKIIDSLHGELQEYKDGLLKKHIQSMVMDIIKIIDDVRKIVRHYRDKELDASDLPKLLDILEDLPSDLEDAFSFQGIRPFTCEGDAFNPARQRVLQKVQTQDESLDKTVAKRLMPGYEWDDNIIRLEMVGVYTYKPVSED